MHTPSRWLIVPALIVGVGSFLLAQEPAAERTAGKVLLLKNGSVVQGDIVKVGTQMCVRRGKSEVWIDCDQTAQLWADWDDAYSHMQAKLKPSSADERLRLARWCHLHHLNDKALEQGKLAVQQDPNHREAKLFVAMLERASNAVPAKSSMSAEPPAAIAPAPPPITVSAETFASFAANVQPILMNKCARCHAGGGFRLDRVTIGGQQIASHGNLNTVLAYVNIEKPGQSPLLVKAIEAHGGALAAPLKDRQTVPFQVMLAWIEQTIATNPQVKERYAAKKPAKATREVETTPLPTTKKGPVVVSRQVPRVEIAAELKLPSVVSEPTAAVKQTQAQLDYVQAMARQQPLPAPVQKIAGNLQQQIKSGAPEPPPPVTAPRPITPIDPFDPVLFNQANHPHGPSWQSRPSVSASR